METLTTIQQRPKEKEGGQPPSASMRLKAQLDLMANRKLEGRTKFQGLTISIETDRGSVRQGVDRNGKEWRTTMKYPYGYIRMTKGVDGDHVDCYIGPSPNAKEAYIIHQKDPVTGKYDEDKVMLGFSSADFAKKAFLIHYNDPAWFGSMTTMSMDEFKKKVLGTKDNPAKIHAGVTHVDANLSNERLSRFTQ